MLERGDPASEEVRVARAWLRQVGALPREGFERVDAGQEEARSEQAPAMAAVHGRMTFGTGPGDVMPQSRALLFLHDYPNRVVYLRIRTDEQGNFSFPKVPPGVYMLTDRGGGPTALAPSIGAEGRRRHVAESGSGQQHGGSRRLSWIVVVSSSFTPASLLRTFARTSVRARSRARRRSVTASRADVDHRVIRRGLAVARRRRGRSAGHFVARAISSRCDPGHAGCTYRRST